MYAYPLTCIAIGLIVLLLFYFTYVVGKQRVRSKIQAPAMVGDAGLERAIRVHGNTIEQLAMFLPALLIALPLIGDLYAMLLTLIWIAGRIIYGRGYMRDPKARGTGFIITVLPLLAALLCGFIGAIRALILVG